MIELTANRYGVRTVRTPSLDRQEKAFEVEQLREARRLRANLKRKLYRRRPEVRAKQRAYEEAYRARPGMRDRRGARKAAWRKNNRAKYNAYFRRYDQLKPGRKEYKAMKAREYRARDRAAKASA